MAAAARSRRRRSDQPAISSLRRISADLAQVVAVEVEAIEGVVDEAIVAPLAEVGLQKRELGHAVRVLDHELAVEHARCFIGRPRSAVGERLAEFLRPVEPAAGRTASPGRRSICA